MEASELLEIFQWLTDEQSAALDDAKRREAAHEIADVLIYVVRFADVLGVDIAAAVEEKMKINAEKYPADLAWGKAAKYTDLESQEPE